MAEKPLPSVGTRLSLSGFLGTVRYTGTVSGTKGEWLGVEWDDATRGKHDGVKDGQQYFKCLVPNSGSFIRPSAPQLDYGRSFLSALVDKYVELPRGSSGSEYVTLGSSNGTIQVEAVNLDKIRGKFSNLERLREISLDKEGVASHDEPGAIRDKCSNLRGVDLSYSLVPSWDVVYSIAKELPLLERLVLNNNRLQPFLQKPSPSWFSSLYELQLSGTMISWAEMISVISFMPALKHVEIGYNRLSSFSFGSDQRLTGPPLELLNFDSNMLHSWFEIVDALKNFSKLSKLILTNNNISSIPHPTVAEFCPLPWTYVSLASTRIASWKSVDALAQWCPGLQGLSLYGTPLVEDPMNIRAWRQIVIARLPALTALDGTPVSDRQRRDAELFYISFVARVNFASDEERSEAHPRFLALCRQHETSPETRPVTIKEDKLSSRLISIKAGLVHVPRPPETNDASPSFEIIRILPTAPLRTVRMKLLKSLKAPRGVQADLWVRMVGGAYSHVGEPDGSDEGREIGWWLEEESEVMLCLRA